MLMAVVLVALAGLSLALVLWGMLRNRRPWHDGLRRHDRFLSVALILAAFVLGVFFAYIFLVAGNR